MKAPHAHSPSTGAPLSDESEYPPGTRPGQSSRTPVDGTGELTTGERRSSRTALQQYFEASYRDSHAGRDAPDDLLRTAGTALYRLKRENAWDVWTWYALAERLARKGYWSTWMCRHAVPRCPRCGSRLQYERSVVGYDYARCGSRCGADSSSERSVEIVERIQSLYEAAFDAQLGRLQAFDPTSR